MTSRVSTKIRLVRCPKCRQLLAELPDVPLYKCGGCGTILQAKNRKMETNHNEQALQVKYAVANTQHEDNTVVEKETRSDSGFPAEESSLNKKHVICEHGESSKVNCSESEDSTVEVKIPLQNGKNECRLGREVLYEFPSSSEQKDSTTEDTQKQDDQVNEYIKRNQNEGEESQRALEEGENFLVKDQNLPEVKDEGNDSPQDETSQNLLAFENGDESSSVEIVSHESGDSAQTVELSIEVYDDTEDLSTVNSPSSIKESEACIDNSTPPQIALLSLSTEEELKTGIDNSTPPQIALKSPSTEEEPKTGIDNTTPPQIALKSPSTEEDSKTGIDNSTPPHIPSKGSTTSDDPISPDDELLVRHRGSISSVDTTGNSTPADHNSELPVKNGGTRNYYAYYSSESSYDGTDDRIQEHVSHPIRRTIKDVDPISTREGPLRNRFRVNNTVNSNHEMNYRRPISSSILQERQHHSMKSRLWNDNEFAQTERESGFTRLPPFHSREFASDHRIGNPSVYRHNPLPPHPVFHSRDERPYSVPYKMDLLRTVCELKDQLDRIKFPKYAPNMRYTTQVVNEEPSHYYAQEREIYADSNLIPGREEQSNHHRPAFSGEAAHYRHQFNCSCSYCYPQERYHSAQFPSHLSSPQHYSSSEISLWGRETKSDEERRHRDDEIKRLYLKEKYHTPKRHLRPLAGAAPVLTCYHCLELLQLPEDFLLFEKRCNRLRCNACQKVLKLSLLNRTRLVPYLSGGPAPPHNEAEPVSFSDEYGRSFGRNCSTEEDASNDRKMKSTLKESLSENKSSIGSSKGVKMRNPSSEIEEERQSTLHQLMGYESLSQVFEK